MWWYESYGSYDLISHAILEWIELLLMIIYGAFGS
jgi:hypothetical protein